jgi:hypothetical protein
MPVASVEIQNALAMASPAAGLDDGGADGAAELFEASATSCCDGWARRRGGSRSRLGIAAARGRTRGRCEWRRRPTSAGSWPRRAAVWLTDPACLQVVRARQPRALRGRQVADPGRCLPTHRPDDPIVPIECNCKPDRSLFVHIATSWQLSGGYRPAPRKDLPTLLDYVFRARASPAVAATHRAA